MRSGKYASSAEDGSVRTPVKVRACAKDDRARVVREARLGGCCLARISIHPSHKFCAGELTTNEGFERRVVFLRCGTVFSRAVGDQFREVSKALREERAGVVDFEP